MSGFLIAALLVVVGFWWLANRTQSSTPGTASTPVKIPLVPLPHSMPITNGAISIQAANYSYYKLTVPEGSTSVYLDGHFSATGGFGNDIEVYVLTEDQFVNFQNGHSTPTYYNSGKVTQSGINARLPGGGTYYLVFNNRFSLLTPKAVQANATLHYTN